MPHTICSSCLAVRSDSSGTGTIQDMPSRTAATWGEDREERVYETCPLHSFITQKQNLMSPSALFTLFRVPSLPKTFSEAKTNKHGTRRGPIMVLIHPKAIFSCFPEYQVFKDFKFQQKLGGEVRKVEEVRVWSSLDLMRITIHKNISLILHQCWYWITEAGFQRSAVVLSDRVLPVDQFHAACTQSPFPHILSCWRKWEGCCFLQG